MNNKRIQQLSEHYLEGTLLPHEWKELKEYLLSGSDHPEFNSVLEQSLENKIYEPADKAILERILRNISFINNQQRITAPVLPKQQSEAKVIKPGPASRFALWWVKYAAVILIIIGISTYLWNVNQKGSAKGTSSTEARSAEVDILPGTNKALLTLSDGTIITLDSIANGAIAQQGNSSVIKLANGEVRYDAKGISHGGMIMNTMSTPRGGQYQLTLADGTKVWLNAASSITYPAVFITNERKIKITGEAYLEVAKDKSKPFLVDIDGKSTVQVLGTSFNINAYTNESTINTTLIDGSVKVFNSNQNIILKPGQQARANMKIEIVNADINQVIAWKNGLFNFNNASLEQVMRQLERWYDVQVVYDGKITPRKFGGEIQRDLNLSEVLEILKDAGVQFTINDKKLIVHPY